MRWVKLEAPEIDEAGGARDRQSRRRSLVHVDRLKKLIIGKKCASRAIFCFSAPSPLGRVSRVLEALQAVQLLPSPRLVTRGETQLPPPNSSPNGPKQGLSLLLKQVLSGGVRALLYSVARQGVEDLGRDVLYKDQTAGIRPVS